MSKSTLHPLLALLVLLSGCTTTTLSGNTSSYWVLPPVGSKVRLNQELAAETGSRLTVQHGRQVKRREVAPAVPHCYFRLLRTPKELPTPVSIAPDTFTMTRVYRLREYSALDPVQYAASGDNLMLAQSFNSGASNAYLSIYMELSSSKQPRVKQLVCTRWDIPQDQNFLSIDDMRAALGDIADIVLPD